MAEEEDEEEEEEREGIRAMSTDSETVVESTIRAIVDFNTILSYLFFNQMNSRCCSSILPSSRAPAMLTLILYSRHVVCSAAIAKYFDSGTEQK